MRAALAVCGRFQHESSSPCYRSSSGWVDCLRLSESAASCGAASSADTTSSSPGSRYRAREARRSSARSLQFVGRRACTPSGQPGPFQSPCLNRPVDRQAYRSCRPSSSRLPPRQTRLSKSPRRRSPSLYSAQLRTWYFFCFACLYWLLGILHGRTYLGHHHRRIPLSPKSGATTPRQGTLIFCHDVFHIIKTERVTTYAPMAALNLLNDDPMTSRNVSRVDQCLARQ